MRCGRGGFTLLELISVVALIVFSLVFLSKFHLSGNQERKQIQNATRILYTLLESARQTAIAANMYTYVAIDLEGEYQQRRIFLIHKKGDQLAIKEEIFLPEHIFVLTKAQLSEIINDPLNLPLYDENLIQIGGSSSVVYLLTFQPNGHFKSNEEDLSAILGIGYGYNDGEVHINSQVDCSGILLTATGKPIILSSSKAIKDAL